MSKFDPYEHLNVSHNRDGSLTRYIKLSTSTATADNAAAQIPYQAVISKDVTLDPDRKTWMRIYRPAKLSSAAGLPIILYFHPAGWIQMSIAHTIIHEKSNRISAEVSAILVAVEFRLAPEHRLPAPYKVAMDALLWVKNQSSDHVRGDQWIRDYGDLTRWYLYGVAAAEDRLNHTQPAALRLEEADPERAKARDGRVFSAAGSRSAVATGAAGRIGPGSPVLQPLPG